MKERDNRLPKKTTFVFQEVVFSTVDIERGQFVEISPQVPATPVLVGQRPMILNPTQEIPGGTKIEG